MVLKLGRFSPSVIACVKLNRQQERRFIMQYQKKYLSNMLPDLKRSSVKEKTEKFLEWYDEFTGMDEVRKAHKRVLEDEELFRQAQEIRRAVLNKLTEVQQKLKDLYVELENTPRGDDRYVTLITQEHKLLKEEKIVQENFSRAEKLERERFSALSSSVKLSHEKERAQSERTKYWSVMGSVLGTVLGILGSSINNHFKMNELKQLVTSSGNRQILDSLSNITDINEKIVEKYANVIETDASEYTKIEEVLTKIEKRLVDIEQNFKNVQDKLEKNLLKTESYSEKGVLHTVPTEEEILLEKRYNQGKLLLVTVTLLSILVSIITRN